MLRGVVRSALVAILLAATIAMPVAFAQTSPETRGPRPEIAYGADRHGVTLTFYIGQNDSARMQETVDILQENNVTEAVFFMHPNFPGNNTIVNSTAQAGYTVLPWSDANQYDANFAPSSFDGILLSDRAVLTRIDKTADVVAFYNLALHQSNSSVIAFTPSAPQFNSTSVLLEEILKDGGRTLDFVAERRQSGAASMAISPFNVTIGSTAVGTNTTSSVTVDRGNWTMQTLQAQFPQSISTIQTEFGPGYLVNTTVVIGEDASLSIAGENVLIASPAADKDRRIEVSGRMTITDSLVSSWDLAANAPDASPYHQRPFLFSDGGQLDITNSTVRNMGFPLGGLSEIRSARAAIMFHDSSDFAIANSTIAFNYDGIYARNSSNFQIAGNEIYGNTRSGIDIRSGSHNFSISENRVHDNAYEGVICTECSGVTIARNVVEHNKEAGIKLFSKVNSTNVTENTVRYNEKFGIYLKDNSTDNMIRENTIIESRAGITLLESSNSNFVVGNVIRGNDAAIDADGTSQSNVLRNNQIG
jgi:parallel beta-helix repeat protein